MECRLLSAEAERFSRHRVLLVAQHNGVRDVIFVRQLPANHRTSQYQHRCAKCACLKETSLPSVLSVGTHDVLALQERESQQRGVGLPCVHSREAQHLLE